MPEKQRDRADAVIHVLSEALNARPSRGSIRDFDLLRQDTGKLVLANTAIERALQYQEPQYHPDPSSPQALSSQEVYIIRLRSGLAGVYPIPRYKEIGDRLGISWNAAERTEQRGYNKLSELLAQDFQELFEGLTI